MSDYFYDPLDLVFGDTLTEARAAWLETQFKLAKGRRFALGGIPDLGVKSDAYVTLPGACVVRLDDPCRVKIHAMGLVSLGTGYFKLYSMTAGADVVGSERTFASTSATLQVGAALDLPAGDYYLKVKISNAAYHVIVYGAALVAQ